MFTAMYCFKDSFGCTYYRNARIGGYRKKANAINAILRMSPHKAGCIQIGQRIISIVVNGREISA